MTPNEVSFVLPSLNGGGAERAAVTVMNALDRERFHPSLCLFRREGAYLGEVASDIDVREIDGASRFGRVAALRRHFERSRPRVVMAFLSYVSVFSGARWANHGIKFVINQQTPVSAFLDDADYQWRQPLRRALFERGVRQVYPRADLIVATSAGVRDDLVGRYRVPAARVSVVPNPVDLATLRQRAAEPIEPALLESGDPVVVSAGRLAEVKHFPLLIGAIRQIASRRPVRLWILGQGEQEPALRRLATEQGLGDRVSFLGFQSNPWRYIARAQVFALTSRYEGFGNVLIEAMACGVPVVATASSGTRQIVEPGRNGLLVDQHVPEAVAAAIESVLASRERAQSLADEASRRVAAYDVGRVVAQYQSLFEQLIAA